MVQPGALTRARYIQLAPTIRKDLVAKQFQYPEQTIRYMIDHDKSGDSRRTYTGLKLWLTHELAGTNDHETRRPYSKKAFARFCGAKAITMMVRAESMTGALSEAMTTHVRLSSHASKNVNKLSFPLIPGHVRANGNFPMTPVRFVLVLRL